MIADPSHPGSSGFNPTAAPDAGLKPDLQPGFDLLELTQIAPDLIAAGADVVSAIADFIVGLG